MAETEKERERKKATNRQNGFRLRFMFYEKGNRMYDLRILSNFKNRKSGHP